jgi:hypothetical protein
LQGVNAASGQISFAAFVTTSGANPPSLQCRVQQESDATDLNVDATSNYTSCTSPQVGGSGLQVLATHVALPSTSTSEAQSDKHGREIFSG